ncbi:WG repeat-containing protein [Roseivirga echinicomitans]|uniref:WG repeat-containing protein n=1 Tax=Roseivirga echinicomitans TaxID=296218 RepID=A0A150XX27_9BACT|nr:WG repeat-containing protein [Roseivirga echinicomitans]KYG83273.1 hypothetical protein AWN68_00210 [Roseivirga echinicomitans]
MSKGIQLFIGVILISLFTLEIPTRAFRLYEKGDTDKAIEVLNKSLEKESLNPAGNFLYSMIFVDSLFNEYSIDSAYHFVNKAISNFKQVKDAKDLAKLKEIGVDSVSLEKQKDKIDGLKFKVIKAKHTIEDYDWFLKKHNDAAQVPQAIQLRNHIAYENALAQNTWEGYLAFMTEYPKAEDFEKAMPLYEKLLFEEMTADGKLESLTGFLEEYPETPYHESVEKDIYEIVTATNSIEDYTGFLKKYPNEKLVQKSIPRLYHLFKEEYPNQDFFKYFNFQTAKDSIEKVTKLEAGYWLPKIEDGKIDFINAKAEITLRASFDKVDTDCLCLPQLTDFVIGEKGGLQQIVARNGNVIYQGDFDKATDVGFGYIQIESESGFTLVHKSGELIVDQPMSSIAILNSHFIRTEHNGFYGLTTINRKPILDHEFIDIDTIGNFIWLQKEEGIALVKPEVLFPAANREKVDLNFQYEDVELLDDGNFWVVKNGQEAILDTSLKTKIPFGIYKIYPKIYGWQLKSAKGIQLFHNKHLSLKDLYYEKVVENNRWFGLKKDGKWTLLDQVGDFQPMYNYDSLGLWGENMVMLKKEAQTTALFANGKQIEIKKGWEPKLLIPQNYISTGVKAEFDFLMLTGPKKARKIYNSFGREILSTTLEDAVALGPNLIRLQKNNAALTDSTGNYVLNFVYDGIGSNTNGYVSILDKGKVGVINISKQIKIPPSYNKLIEPYSDTVMVATKGKLKGFISTKNRELSAFDYDEIKYFTDTVALARIENEWFLHGIQDESLLYEGILNYKILEDNSQEKKLLITTEKGKGIYSNIKGEIIEATYDEIKVLGATDDPIYFAVKIVSEANIYVVIYFDKNGNKLFTQTFKQDEYFKIACPKN